MAACRYRPQPLLCNSRIFISQPICSDIILIPSVSSNIQQQYPKLLLFFVVVSTLHQLICWEDAQGSTCNSPWAISQINPMGWEQTHEFVHPILHTETWEGNNLFRTAVTEPRAEPSSPSTRTFQVPEFCILGWVVPAPLRPTLNLQEEFPSFNDELLPFQALY